MILGYSDQAIVFILNLLLGWTLIAWVVALAMAFATVDRNA